MNITSGKIHTAQKVVIYGVEGIPDSSVVAKNATVEKPQQPAPEPETLPSVQSESNWYYLLKLLDKRTQHSVMVVPMEDVSAQQS